MPSCGQTLLQARNHTELSPLKWSELKYGFGHEEDHDGKEEAYG